MAELVGAAIISAETAAAVGATVGITGTAVTTLVGSTALLGAGIGVNLLAASLQDTQKVAAQQFSVRQAIPSRTRSYGRAMVAGPYVQWRSVGAFIFAIYHGEGPWDAIEEWYLDGLKTNIASGSGGGVVTTTPWRNYVDIESRLGGVGQALSGILQTTPGWDGAHALNGCVYSAVRSRLPPEKKFKNYYPKQTYPDLRVVGRACLVRNPYDPNSFTWTDRAGPCIFDFITHPTWGLRVPVEMMNLPMWQAFSDLCSETVISRDGTAFPRYFLGGTYNLTDDPADTLAAMLAACDATLTLEQDGTIGIHGGKAPAPGFTITDDMITSIQIEGGGLLLKAFNRLKPSYVSPAHGYQQVEARPWDDLTAQQASGELLEQDFARPWVQSFNQIRRLAKIAMEKGNPSFKITLVTTLAAAQALFKEAVEIDSDAYPIFEGLIFLVGRAVANVAQDTCTLELQSLDPGCYAFDPGAEEGIPPALPNTQAGGDPPLPPQNLSVSLETRAITGNSDGNYNAVFLRLTATRPADREDLSLLGRYRLSGAGTWTNMAADTDNAFSLISGALVNGATYEVQGAVSTYGQGLVSDYVGAAGSPVTINNAAPEFPQQQPDPGSGGSNGGQGTT